MATELEVGADKEVTPPLEPKATEPTVPEPKVPEENPDDDAKASEVQKETEQLANIKKAISDETERLREIRKKQKLAKQGIIEDDEEVIPQIDKKDPAAKAWMREIAEATDPTRNELEKAKEERRLFTLQRFLKDKPALAKNPEKVKAMMETYDRLKTSTELTNEGIEMDLEKAYAAEHYQELISADREARTEQARNEVLFSDPAVSRGSTAHATEKSKPRVYDDDQKAILAKWNMTPAEHAAMVEEQAKKVG